MLENLLFRNGSKRKFVVLKIADLLKYINSPFKLAMLENDMLDIVEGRKKDGKNPENEYIIINTDEPYANEVIEILKKNGHWG
ncbi:MAG: hypothetical protein K0Q47_89 [Sedimentibacter sp.]|jgi:hypothetical protein|nr:hypothetical protein [Sedimentibacter sp.]